MEATNSKIYKYDFFFLCMKPFINIDSVFPEILQGCFSLLCKIVLNRAYCKKKIEEKGRLPLVTN